MNRALSHDISVQEVKQLLDRQESFLLLDCRNQDEYDLVHLESAMLIPMPELQNRLADLQAHQASRIVVYCHLGGRSQVVADSLRQQDFAHVQNMTGGIDAWAEEIDRTLPRY